MVLRSLQSPGQSSNSTDPSVRTGNPIGSFDQNQSIRGTIQRERRCTATHWHRVPSCSAGQHAKNRASCQNSHLGPKAGALRIRSIIPGSNVRELSDNIIQKGLAFRAERSGTGPNRGARRAQRICPAGLMAEVGRRWCGQEVA
jgi:hypothetical protein